MESRGCFSQLLCCWGESTSQPELTSFTSLPKHREIKHVILRAMYDFKAIEEDDLSFSQGDLLKKENPGWWFDCSRSQAEALLMRYEVAIGSFLVRGSLCQNHSVLSMKYQQDAGETHCVFHYKIRHTDGGERFISRRKIFPDLFSLVAHYREHQDGLKCRLTVPCRRLPPIKHLRTMKVTRGSISLSETLAEDVWRGGVMDDVSFLTCTYNMSDD
ncbi:tyrosine-protein kinase HCK-like [Haliotis cracherodii]|uniref:tyrosine-protein kinase HCK-like n=1 Tax=Haliotis cracherodii TaxID=6455 RepID=UPI0039E94C89